MTPEFRVSFPHVFTANQYENNDPKFSVVMLFDKGTSLKKLKKLVEEAAAEKWPKGKPKNFRSPFRDGDDKDPMMDGYEGCIYVTASSKQRPGVVDQDVQKIIDEDEFYAGCYARATVTAYAYDVSGNKGVAFGLQNVQKLRDGERFSGRSAAEDDFEAVERDDDEDFDDDYDFD